MRSIDWFISRKCESTLCPFCYAPYQLFPPDVNINDAIIICDEIIKNKIDFVTLCGGEPLLFDGIEEICKYLYNNGIKIILTTGLAFHNSYDRIARIEKYINILSLPLDAIVPEHVEKLRGNAVNDTVLNILERYSNSAEHPSIKIGTVVNKINLTDIPYIYYKIKEYDYIISVWRLYMFSPYGLGLKNKIDLLITEKEYTDTISYIEKINRISPAKFEISIRTRNENKGYCMIMDSQGNFYRYNENYEPLGVSIFDDYFQIENKYNMSLHYKQKNWQKKESVGIINE